MTAPHRDDGTDADVPVVVLLSADWAGPSRPAPTVLRELSVRWGTDVRTLLLEDPSDEVLDLLEVDVLPTWLRFTRDTGSGPGDAGTGSAPDRVPELRGRDPQGEAIVLPGPWVLQRRRTGALPKHAVDAEFGPDAETPPRAESRA